MKKLRNWYHNIKRQLSSRLLILICVTFLPLNVVMLGLSTTIYLNSSAEIANAWQRETQTAMDNFQREILMVEQDVDQFVSEYISELMLDSSDTMTSITMVNSLDGLFEKAQLPGFLFLREKKTGYMYTKYDASSMNINQLEQAKEVIRNNLPHGTGSSWQLVQVAQRYYFMRHYEYANYCLGIYVDVEEVFRSVHSNDAQRQDALYISDGSIVLQRGETSLEKADAASLSEAESQNPMTYWIHSDAAETGLWITVGIRYVRFTTLVPPFAWILLLVAFLSFFLIGFIWHSLQNQVVKPLRTLQAGMEELKQHDLSFRLEIPPEMETDELQYLFQGFNHMAEEVESSYKKDIKMYQAELDNLRLQINPHMLLNSYNLIYSLAQTKNYECIQEYTLHLSDYFRYVLRENNNFVKLSREMKFISSYIAIQEIRFPGAIRSSCDISEEAMQGLIPPLLVENFVENAMKYALIPGKTIDVSIKAWVCDDRMQVAIEDNGQGIQPEVLERITRGKIYVDKLGQKHIGIYNCRRRMELFYRGQAGLTIDSQIGKGTRILLDLPYLLEAADLEAGGMYYETFNCR